jgi:RNA-directed DNA polymerase
VAVGILAMSQLQALRTASTLQHVADLLDYKPKALSYILYKIPSANKYTTFSIPKRDGTPRDINAPCSELKELQSHLSDLLLGCVKEINETRKFKDQLSHAFKPEHTIVTNAVRHQKKRYVFNIDLQDFFSTINFGRVRGYFIKDANFMLHAKVATILAQIACHDHKLPQGSPCSPVMSNLVGHILDIQLCRFASKNGCTYSRYADDITFSTNKPIFPADIAKSSPGKTHAWQAGDALQKVIARSGFSINEQKTRMQYRGSRQVVTGLTVNRKVNIKNDYRRTVRVFTQRVFNTGKFQYIAVVTDSTGAKVPTKVDGSLAQLHGMFGHIDFVDNKNKEAEEKRNSGDSKAKATAKNVLYSKRKLYRRFLIFKDLYVAPRPVIICEGKTDNVYLLHAIKSLAAKYPILASIATAGKVQINVRLLRAFDSGIGTILHLGHGASDLDRLAEQYATEIKRFKAHGMEQAVVLLMDNDDGADEMYKLAKTLTAKSISRVDPYFHLVGNLYVVVTPLIGAKKQSEIEDSFVDTLKNIILDGKTLSTKNKFDTTKYFGKHIFAQHVRENASKIDFSGFAGILDRISDAIQANQERVAASAAAQSASVAI